MSLGLKGKKVLVTGGAGFIGSHTVDALIKNGAVVAVVDDLSTGNMENINPEANFYNVNIADAEFEKILEAERPDIIYHFAFFVLVNQSVEDPMKDVDVITGTLRMLKKIREQGIEKIVFSSSGLLYGNTVNLPAKENGPIEPVSAYVVSKCAIENYLKFFRAAYGIPYVTVRYSTVFGPRQTVGAMPDYIRKLAQGGQAMIWGDGRKTRDYVFIDDVIRANLLVLTVPDNHLEPVFNISTGIETSLNTLYGKIARLLHKEPAPIYYPDRPGEQIRFALDNSKAKKHLEWEPRVSLDEGLKATIDYAKSKNIRCCSAV
ncbi:MAG: NAD-dependent epimerase/dehydratase family protein [Phycisphaerae bacterium]|jgi:UDP-glucose 4-epimerase